jgi:hypothetical protein
MCKGGGGRRMCRNRGGGLGGGSSEDGHEGREESASIGNTFPQAERCGARTKLFGLEISSAVARSTVFLNGRNITLLF